MSDIRLSPNHIHVTTTEAYSDKPHTDLHVVLHLTHPQAIAYLFALLDSQGTPNVSEAIQQFFIERSKIEREEAWGE